MTVSVGNPSQEFRQDTVMPMEVFSLYADSIFPELAGTVFAPGQRCWVFTHPKYFWAITPTPYRGISGTAKSPTPRGACHESLRFPLFPPATQEAGDSPVRGDHDEKVPPLRR